MPARRFTFFQFVSREFVGAVVFAFLVFGSGNAQQQPLPARPPQPLRVFVIQGQVSLPDGRPAVHALVTLTSSGARRQIFSGEEGRFEFPPMDGGSYSLSASVKANGDKEAAELVSEIVDADTTRTATNRLNVNLTLRDPTIEARKPKARVVTAAETAQRIPKEARKAFQQGTKFKEEGEREKAFERFSKAIELYPEYFQALSERGDLYIAQRKLSEAEADFAGALKLDERYAAALRGSGYCKLEKREFAQAIDAFERSVSAEPDNANTYLLLGIANLELDRRDPARRALEKALSFNYQPVPRAHIYLANIYALEQQFLQAADELRKYLDLEPQSQDHGNLEAIEARWRARATKP